MKISKKIALDRFLERSREFIRQEKLKLDNNRFDQIYFSPECFMPHLIDR